MHCPQQKSGLKTLMLLYGSKMPSPTFFQKLGCFVRRDFWSQKQCTEICVEMRAAAQVKGEVSGPRHTAEEPDVVDETVRRVLRCKVADSWKAEAEARFEQLKPELEKHFQM